MMTKQFLHRADVIAVFQQMGGKRMPQAMATRRFLKATLTNRLLYCFLGCIDVHMMAPF
jgi:hypothetical protein